MIEVYLFLAAFPVQILAMSVLYPMRLARLVRTARANIPATRLADLYPGVDVVYAQERFLSRYRAANTVVAVLGSLLLGWFMSYMQQPGWDDGTVGGLITAYLFLQYLPIALFTWATARFNKVHRRSPLEGKRKAILQRRGPFDFVSPYVVLLGILNYFLFAAFMLYIAQNPFPGFAGPFVNIGIVTLMYVALASVAFLVLYGRKDALQTHADRVRLINAVLNGYAWLCIVVPIFLSLHFARRLLDLTTWGPFVGTVYFLILAALSFRGLIQPVRRPETEEIDSSPVHQ